ncbi:MAG TPA: hypothetical protein DCQ93_02870, partial [Bacteroidetes bacterium]|nr:hypothetical protein [Bacteroidota bacterium]
IDGNEYQIKHESSNKSVEVFKKKMVRQWWTNKLREEWERMSMDNFKLYLEVVKFHLYSLNRQMIMETSANQSMLDVIKEYDNKFQSEKT